jgi:hypothetical protein
VKIIRIERCGECPNFINQYISNGANSSSNHSEGEYWCKVGLKKENVYIQTRRRKISKLCIARTLIPTWCPLEKEGK